MRMLDDGKICFITCVNDEQCYKKSVEYIQRLKIPRGFKIELLSMRGSTSMAAAYNAAMKQSDAKYKVYMHQDVFIIHRNFIEDLLKIFSLNPQIGLAGLVGAQYLPSSGTWWDSPVLLGQIFDNHLGTMQAYSYKGNDDEYTEAAAIDGLLLATQYDIAWREDVFKGWHFYDLAQCMEFRHQNYKVVVLGQKKPWCVHACGKKIIINYNVERMKFLAEYAEDLLPLVSIMIPTYNRPEYFKIALDSSLAQTYPKIEIIVCDNSTDERTSLLMEKYTDPRIIYLRNREAKTKEENFRPFEEMAHGEYLQWLMDDDVLEPDKIERMRRCFFENPTVTLATSNRRWIDDLGREIKSVLQFDFGSQVEYQIISGKAMGKHMLTNIGNNIGEPSAVLFRRKDLTHHYWGAECRGYVTISDVAMWLELLQRGDIACFQQPLSAYRRHEGQEGQQDDVILLSRLEWIRLLKECREEGYFIENDNEYKMAIRKLVQDAKDTIFPCINLLKKTSLVDTYKRAIEKLTRDIL